MKRVWEILIFSFAMVGLCLAIILVLFASVVLPERLYAEREALPPSLTLAPVQAVATENLDMDRRPWPLIDDVHVQPGDRILLAFQFDSRENGIWIVPSSLEGEWVRAKDLSMAYQVLEGAHVYVLNGKTYRGQTLVLRVLSSTSSTPGEVDLYFVPLLQHLFFDVHPSEEQVLCINRNGLPIWKFSEDIKQAQSHPIEAPLLLSPIPAKLHFIYGFWDEEKSQIPESIQAWKDSNREWSVHVWTQDKCNHFVTTQFPEFVDLWKSISRDIVRVDLIRWLILLSEGGVVLDVDTRVIAKREGMAEDMDQSLFSELWKKLKYPRMCLLEESPISEYEADILNSTEIRHGYPVRAGTVRIGSHMLASVPQHPFIHFMLQHIRDVAPRVSTTHDYDVVFASGSDAVTWVYHKYGKGFSDIEVLSSASFIQHDAVGAWKKGRYCMKKR